MTERELRAIVQTNIRRYRGYRKWTQAQFAEKLDISINFLSDIENGKKWISPKSMVKFASILNIEPFELFKPADVPATDVSALFSRYNDEVVMAVSESIKRTYDYYQAFFDEKSPSGTEDAGSYKDKQMIDHPGLVAEAGVAESKV